MYMGMAAILLNSAQPFEWIVNILSTEDPPCEIWRKLVKRFQILYIYIAQRQITRKILTVAKQFYFFNHTL